MNWSKAESNQWIKDVNVRMLDNGMILSWQWPREIEFVYIVKAIENQEISLDLENSLPMKLYTREEYKSNAGYKDYINSLGKVVYKIYPALRINGAMTILKQENQDNEIMVKAQKAKIYYSIKYKKGWFNQQKTVKISINSEMALPMETLCYVKKKGSNPVDNKDGSIYSFTHDFEPGRCEMPEIQVNKDDFIRLFFTDGKRYGDLYELIPE